MLATFSPESSLFSSVSWNIKIRIYKNKILPVILYSCEKWSLILREEYRLKVFEKRVLRRIFGPKSNEMMGGLIKLHKSSCMICNLRPV
jgi:hypothetical protein